MTGFLREYGESLRTLRPGDVFVSVLAGLVSGLFFLFLFPGRAISTLMHQVMHLPGPGAGIGFVVGPYIVLCALIMWRHLERAGVVFYVCFISGAVQAFGGDLAGPASVLGGEVMFQMVIASLVLGVVTDLSAFATRNMAVWKAYITVAVVADLIYLSTYWIVVFPPVKGWVKPVPAGILLGVSVVGAIIFGALVPLVYARIRGGGDAGRPGEWDGGEGFDMPEEEE